MDRVSLTNTDLQVSQLCLGTADFGTKKSREEAFRQMDIFLDGGGILSILLTFTAIGPVMRKGAVRRSLGNGLREKGIK